MAYNLESLVKIIELITHHDWALDTINESEIESLLEKAQALKQFFRNTSPLTGDKIESLESQIRDAAFEAKDILESHLVEIRPISTHKRYSFSPPILQKVIREFNHIEEEIKKMIELEGTHHAPCNSSPVVTATCSRAYSNPKSMLVGLSQGLTQLKDRLTSPEDKLEIIPVVGMGGIGKTTLTRILYDDPLITAHFDVRAWVTISQVYKVQEILLGLLDGIIGRPIDQMLQEDIYRVDVTLHKSLWGRRYLIVLDDMWDMEAWDEIMKSFPDQKNGSRIIVTTRDTNVASYAGGNSAHHVMQLLNRNDSWNLLRRKVFAEECCPAEMEKIGEEIAENCRGLPLAINVIGGVLSQLINRSHWVQVAKDVASSLVANNEKFPEILSLSYNHLPVHLRPCFLYMSAFPEDYEVRSSTLIRLWVAEGFLEPIPDQSLEEAAEIYLKALVNRNLIFVRQKETHGVAKSYGMHDLLRDLCVRKAHNESFFRVQNLDDGNCGGKTSSASSSTSRRLCVRSCYVRSADDVMMGLIDPSSLSRSFLFMGSQTWVFMASFIFQLTLLRVLDISGINLGFFLKQMKKLVNLRYLAVACCGSLPSSICVLRYLQTLILHRILPHSFGTLPFLETDAIFRIPNLRHIKFKRSHTSFSGNEQSCLLQENLQTLSSISVDGGFGRIVASTPNVKKLGIHISATESYNVDLTCLRKLEKLRVSSDFSMVNRYTVLSLLVLPHSLKKLTLLDCEVPLGYMNKIGRLPNLEVLKLRNCSLESSTWELSEGEFSRLQFLVLEKVDLAKWVVDPTHLPRLERLVVRECYELEEIPSDIGEIPTLEIIEVHDSNPSAMASVREIYDEQLQWGNYDLQVLIS